MAEVHAALGDDEQAKASAQRAFAMSGSLPREDRYLIEARYREATKEWSRAISLYQSLLAFFPESLEYGLALGNAQLAAGQSEAAKATVVQLRKRMARASSDPRVNILDGRATTDAGDPKGALALFERAASQGATIGASLLVARARLEAAYTLESLGQHDRALECATLARSLFAAAGDRSAAADALMAMGAAIALEEHRLADAEALARRAAEQFSQERQGDNEGWARALWAEALAAQGRHADAKKAMERAHQLTFKCQNLGIRMFVNRKDIELSYQEHDPDPNVQQDLAAALAEARNSEFRVEEMEAQLTQYKIAHSKKDDKGPSVELSILKQEASQRELVFILNEIETATKKRENARRYRGKT